MLMQSFHYSTTKTEKKRKEKHSDDDGNGKNVELEILFSRHIVSVGEIS